MAKALRPVPLLPPCLRIVFFMPGSTGLNTWRKVTDLLVQPPFRNHGIGKFLGLDSWTHCFIYAPWGCGWEVSDRTGLEEWTAGASGLTSQNFASRVQRVLGNQGSDKYRLGCFLTFLYKSLRMSSSVRGPILPY